MGKRKRPAYRNGPFTLSHRWGEAAADYTDEDGVRRRARLGVPFAKTGAAFEKAKKALDEFAETHRVVAIQRASFTVGLLWKLWLDDRAQDGFNNRIYHHNWKALRPTFENRLPLTLVAQDFRDYAQARFDAGIASSTVHTELSRLRSCLKWAFDSDRLPRRVKVWVPRPGKPRDRVLSIEEARALVAGARRGDPHVYLFVMILFATGARHMAVLDLTWDRIDFGFYPIEGDPAAAGEFRPGVIEFDEDLPPDPMSKAWRKGRATVPMNQSVRRALLDAFEARQTDFVIEHGGKRLTDAGDGFKAATMRAGLGKWVPHPKPGLPDNQRWVTDVTPHVVRHTVATWLEEKVSDARRAQLLGHSGLRTLPTYTHSAALMLTDAVEILDAEFAPLPRMGPTEAVPEVEDAVELDNLAQRAKRGADDEAD